MSRERTKATAFPVDRNDVELIRGAHPPHWKNPTPTAPTISSSSAPGRPG
ncbi:hypothetical protein ACVDG5_030330 [Mesorhizobium sp. ORM6]